MRAASAPTGHEAIAGQQAGAFTATRWGQLLNPALMPEGERTPTATDCYRFALSDPHVDVTLSGPNGGAQLDAAMAALDHGPLDEDELSWMRRVGAVVRRDANKGSPVAFLDRMAGVFRRKATPALTTGRR